MSIVNEIVANECQAQEMSVDMQAEIGQVYYM